MHAHLCRHTYALNFLVEGGGELYLQKILGHRTLAMTQHYANLAEPHVIERQQQFSPTARIGIRALGSNMSKSGGEARRIPRAQGQGGLGMPAAQASGRSRARASIKSAKGRMRA